MALPIIFYSSKAICVSAEESLTNGCKSACLIDYNSGEILYKVNELERLPIASVCKVMTLILTFDAINVGTLKTDDLITVSDRAAGMGGSQVFLEAGCQYPLSQLIKSIIVCSANDSCVAVSEAICGSEATFVAKMNEKAKELGCENTLYANCTGLPKDTQYSCAKDVAAVFRELISNDEYYNYSKIWYEEFNHPDDRITQITNTNKLIKKYSLCDGGKTGFTNEAGFCLAATAQNSNMRLISVVLGAKDSDTRFNCARELFDYGFANYKNQTVLDCGVNLNEQFSVEGGKKEFYSVKPERDSAVLLSNGSKAQITEKIIPSGVRAPIAVGNVVGSVEIYKDGVLYDTVNVVAAEAVDKATYTDYLKIIAREWTL